MKSGRRRRRGGIGYKLIVDVPHHHVNDQFDVVVCYHNLCGGGNTCRTYHMYLPSPCKDEEHHPAWVQEKKQKENNSDFNSEINIRSDENEISRKGLTLYPNPSKGLLTIEGINSGNYVFELYTLNGTKVFHTYGLNNGKVLIDLSEISISGLYFAKISSSTRTDYIKILIQK